MKSNQWKELKEEFDKLAAREYSTTGFVRSLTQRDLSAFFSFADDSPTEIEWKLQDADLSITQDFSILGTKAGKLLASSGTRKRLDVWLDALLEAARQWEKGPERKDADPRIRFRGTEIKWIDEGKPKEDSDPNSNDPNYRHYTSGWIENIGQTSARYCAEYELEALENELAIGHSWRIPQERFYELKSRNGGDKLFAEYYSACWTEALWAGSQWALREAYDLHDEFKRAAELAARTAGRKTWQDWLELLRSEKYGYKRAASEILYSDSGSDNSGQIFCLCEVSERFCRDRADAAGEPLLELETKMEAIQRGDEASNAQKDPKRNLKKKRTPNKEQKIIVAAINTGKNGRELCKELDERRAGPRRTWDDQLYQWPGSFLAAWDTKGRAAKHWHRKITVYIQNIKRDFITKSPR